MNAHVDRDVGGIILGEMGELKRHIGQSLLTCHVCVRISGRRTIGVVRPPLMTISLNVFHSHTHDHV